MTIEQYQELFSACGAEQYAMEATPSYCYGGQPMIDAIRSSLPNPRIIISLRNPTDRLWSAYTFQRSQGNLPGIRSFAQYLAVCEQGTLTARTALPRIISKASRAASTLSTCRSGCAPSVTTHE